jgi:hypothetical protein
MVGDVAGDLIIEADTELLRLLGEGLGHLDLWCERRFGRALSAG